MTDAAASRRSGWALLRRALAKQRRLVVTGVLWGLVWTVAKVAVPSLTGRAIDAGIIRGDSRALGQLLRGRLSRGEIVHHNAW